MIKVTLLKLVLKYYNINSIVLFGKKKKGTKKRFLRVNRLNGTACPI